MSRLHRTTAVLTALLALTVVSPRAQAQEKPVDTLLIVEKYLELEQVSDPKISPDGSQIVHTKRWVNRLDDADKIASQS